MNTHDRQAIEELFAKLHRAEHSGETPPRDPEAEAFIREHMARQPGAAYYMAQTIVVQEQALIAAQERLDALEQELANRPSGGFLAGLFGGGQAPTRPPQANGLAGQAPTYGARGPGLPVPGLMPGAGLGPGASPGPPGGGFLGGAAQTAMGVAGGLVLGSLLAGALAGDGGETASAQPETADGSGNAFEDLDNEAA